MDFGWENDNYPIQFWDMTWKLWDLTWIFSHVNYPKNGW